MEDFIWLLVIIGISLIWGLISWIIKTISNSKKYLKLQPELDSLEQSKSAHELNITKRKEEIILKEKHLLEEYELKVRNHEILVEKDREEWKLRARKWNEKMLKDREEIKKLAKQKSMGFPWLAEAYADYFALKDGNLAEYLENKSHPAYTAAENVKIIKNEKKELVKENKIISYKINYFEKLFPWLSELIADDENEDIPVRIYDISNNDDSEDKVKKYLTPEEYKKLPSVKRNQMALDRYLKNRNKSKWAIGRDYEMYVGYLYEQESYSIEYKGIIDGFDDLGRDVIAKKDDEVCIIQCKNWAHYKEIHEKHIFQLFGTTMEYWIKNFKNNKKPKNFEEFAKFLNENKLRPIFFTSTSLSNKAKEMAEALSIEIIENEPLGEFPRIKCNINSNEFGLQTKIYHLPMDQQYDRTIIGNRAGEFCTFTVKEAEDAGFRRAFKHRYKS